MGWPALIGLALTAAGTASQAAGNAQSANKQNDVAKAELLRQQGYQKRASGEFDNSLQQQGSDGAKKTIDATQNQLAAKSAAVQSLPTSTANSPVDTNPVLQAREQAQTAQQNSAGAKLQGYGQWGMDQAINNMLAAQNLGVTGGLARGSANVLPFELNHASHAGDSLTGLGGILNTLGSAVGTAGPLMGWGAQGNPALAVNQLANTNAINRIAPQLNNIGWGRPLNLN